MAPASDDPPASEPSGLGDGRERLELVHHHPGRLRVRSGAFRGPSAAAALASDAARRLPGVRRVDHLPTTGSILVEYEPGLAEPDALLAALADAAGLTRVSSGSAAVVRTPALLAVGAVQELNSIAAELTGERADLRSLVPLGLAALGAYSFVVSKEPRLPRWDNLLWWSYSVFMGHHGREIETAASMRRRARGERESSPRPIDAARPVRT